MWAAQFIQYEQPHTWLNSGGARARWATRSRPPWAPRSAEPDRTVWAIDGDGCFQMTNQELATCAINNIPIKVAIINNGTLGMVRQWQTLFYNQRYSNTVLHTGQSSAARARLRQARRGHGLRRPALRATRTTSTRRSRKAMAINDRPVVVDFIVHRGRHGVADGRRRHQQRRDPGRPRRPPDFGDNEDD